MSTYKCNKIKKFLCILSHRRKCKKNKINDLPVIEESEPIFIKNKSGRWINKKTGKFVKREVAEAYENHQR